MKEDTGISGKVVNIVLGVAILVSLAFIFRFIFRNDFVASIGKIVNAGKNFTAIFTKDFLWMATKILALFIGVGVWAYILAGYGIFFSFIKSGEIVLVEMGKSFYKLIPNVPGYGVLDNKIAPLADGVKKPRSFLGIFWIGFYPIQKIHRYNFSWDKVVQKNEVETETKKNGVVDETNFGIISHRSEEVASVRHKNSYPIILREMELAGQLKIDIYFNVIFEMVDPVFSVFMLNGKWLSLATDAFSGLVSDFLRKMELRRTPGKSGNAENYFEEVDKESEFSKIFSGKNSIIFGASGAIVAKVVYRDYVISGTKEMKDATDALKKAQLNAEAKIAEASGEGAKIREIGKAKADAIREMKKAEAEGLESKLNAASKHKQGGDIATAQEYAGAIRDFAGGTLIFGGSNVSPMIPVDQKNRKKGVKNGDTNDAV